MGPRGARSHHQIADAGSAVRRIHLEIDQYEKAEHGSRAGQGTSLPQGKRSMHRIGAFALFFSTGIATALGAPAGFDADAVRLNNRGVAQMGQQFTDRAAATFADAFKKDPKLAQLRSMRESPS